MTKRERKKPARPIKTKRDYESASAVAKKMSRQKERDAAAELRLQSLLHELDKFDDNLEEEDTTEDGSDDYGHPEVRRRWSDDVSSPE
jgi:hypothetical protein